MKTEFMLLALYEKPFLNFKETCSAIGISLQAGYNLRSQKAFPIKMIDGPLRASIIDVAAYIDKLRDITEQEEA